MLICLPLWRGLGCALPLCDGDGGQWVVFLVSERCYSGLVFSDVPAGGSGGGDSMIRVENFFLIEINVRAR